MSAYDTSLLRRCRSHQELERLDLPSQRDECGLELYVTRGFASVTYLQDAAERAAPRLKRRFRVVRHRETLPQFRRQVRELIVRIITSDASRERMAAMLKNVHKPSTWPAIREELDRLEEGGGGPLNGRCSAIKANGERCQRSADGPRGLCWAHDPANAAEHQRMASRAARSKAPSAATEVSALKDRLSGLADDVLAGRVDRGDAVAVGQLLNTILRATELERRLQPPAGYISPEELSELMKMVVDLLRRHMPEKERMRAFHEDLQALLADAGQN